MTSRIAGVSGVYSSFPMKRGLIPRHTMRERGFDSKFWMTLLQKGAITRTGAESLHAGKALSPPQMFLTCWSVKWGHLSLTGDIVAVHVVLFRAVSAQEGLDVVVLVPVEGGDALHAPLRVAANDPAESTEAVQRCLRAVLGRQQPQLRVQVRETRQPWELPQGRGWWYVPIWEWDIANWCWFYLHHTTLYIQHMRVVIVICVKGIVNKKCINIYI